MKARYLIVGNSAGGIGAVEAVREADRKGKIVLASDESYPAYSRPMIAKYLSGERGLKEILYRPESFYDANDVAFLPGRKVVKINVRNRSASLDNGDEIRWDKLLLATGGSPIVPKGIDKGKRGVFSFTTLDDARLLGEAVSSGSRVVIVGGGLIGISAAEALRKRGAEVTIVELKDAILNTVLDRRGSAIAQAAVSKYGVNIVTGRTVSKIAGAGKVTGVVLDNGDLLPADAVVLAIGVAPRVELAVAAGLKVNRGVLVDRYMNTSDENIFCCGDAAEAYDFVAGADRVIPVWPLAYIGGRAAGGNMAGGNAEYAGGTAMNVIRYFGAEIASAGRVEADGDCEALVREGAGIYRKVLLAGNRIAGMVLAGDVEKSGILHSLMRERVDVSGFRDALLADDFGLAHLPAEIRAARLGRPAEECLEPARVSA